MTEDTPTGERENRHRPTLGDLSHTHPETGAQFGDTQAYERGPAVAADEGVQRIHERGTEGRERDV
jgi:hypothetical protein